MDGNNRHKPDYILLGTTLVLLAIGIVMVYSSSAIKAHLEFDDPYHFFKRQLAWAAMGIATMAMVMNISYTNLHRYAKPLLYVALALLVIVKIPGVGREVNGAVRWIGLGPLSLQPSEVIKIAMVIFLARYLADRTERIKQFVKGMLPPLGLLALVAGLIMLQPDLGTVLAIAGTTFMILIAAGARWGHIAALGSAGIGLVVLAIAAAPYRMKRILAYLDPWADPSGKGYQTIHALLALGSGGFFGLGFGQSRQKFLYLPESHTDFIFAIIGEELGILGASIVVILFVIFAWRGYKTAISAPDPFASLLAVGITSMVAIQAGINIGVVSGLLPVTGITLPFLSYGGSSLLFTMVPVGILLNISRYTLNK
ncbi:MAG TPA: stage V sporulation protein E [Verrucomicrobiae bacterium]|nr:stage V sporulation protein E [Verrucomicrobiae bacterium]